MSDSLLPSEVAAINAARVALARVQDRIGARTYAQGIQREAFKNAADELTHVLIVARTWGDAPITDDALLQPATFTA